MTTATPLDPTPEQLDAAAAEEAAACTERSGSYWGTECRASYIAWHKRAVRRCAGPMCPHHVHAFARVDAVYCSGTCRMAALRERRRRAAPA